MELFSATVPVFSATLTWTVPQTASPIATEYAEGYNIPVPAFKDIHTTL